MIKAVYSRYSSKIQEVLSKKNLSAGMVNLAEPDFTVKRKVIGPTTAPQPVLLKDFSRNPRFHSIHVGLPWGQFDGLSHASS